MEFELLQVPFGAMQSSTYGNKVSTPFAIVQTILFFHFCCAFTQVKHKSRSREQSTYTAEDYRISETKQIE